MERNGEEKSGKRHKLNRRTNDIKRMEQLTNTDGKIWRTNFII